ncbi:VOC family protein [Cerasicoccus arenae]|uniref:Lactoylglutathione lyase n=1 Tax=Cerasicoccus arenae TaxID=424488 RepID=A0A8J3DCV4_9BACT|nr:VOC family protein [Cerasicoccus arenae]MBK1858661.1 VOC family protein [Cerasicoccus arenae]GHC04740.1 lactoylglutathione lyase [Cerasicoccus arenae]
MSHDSTFRLHHIGYLVENIDTARQHWVDVYGYELDGEIIHDAGQQALVCLLRQPSASHWIELISPDSTDSHLQRALQRKVSLHHVAYAVDNFDSSIQTLRSGGCVPLGKPAIGVAFGRRIMWFHDPLRGLIELISPGPGSYQLNHSLAD